MPMNPYDYHSLCQTINDLPPWKATALCVASAEKVATLIHDIGLPSTWSVVRNCLEHVWSSLTNHANESRVQTLITALHSTPEWECDDPAHFPFIITKALDFVNFALVGSNASSPHEQAE